MKHGSLFSGIGGFDLAAEWMGWENVFHCEWNPFGQKVLKYYWPNAISYNDITKTDFTIHRGTIDIITGGFPCQPYSSAGKRLGKDDERHLWPEMLRCIREVSPRWIVGENVRGLTNWNGGMVFEEVCIDLENNGYQVAPFIIPACANNAPHKRERIWFIAYSNVTSQKCNKRTNHRKKDEIWRKNESDVFGAFCSNGYATNTDSARIQRHQINTGTSKEIRQEWENIEEIRNLGYVRNWQSFPTVSPICNGNDGLSNRLDSITFPKWRNESIKAGGNAVVPQVVYQIFKAIEAYEAT